MNITAATAKGLRPYQEDRYVVHSTGHGTLLAVLDGHGGDDTAEAASILLPGLWDFFFDPSDVESGVRDTVNDLAKQTSGWDAGAALSLVYIPNKGVVKVAILGDAPVIVGKPDGGYWVSPEHNVRTNEAERRAAEARGGVYYNGYICNSHGAGLQMSRALGDAKLQPIVSQEPEIYHMAVDGFVIVASDGVFDPSHYDTESEIKEVVQLVRDGATAQDLVDRAVKKRTGDNATAIVARRTV